MDSNSTTTTIKIDGNRLVYDKSYNGYGASKRKPVHVEKTLGAEDLKRLSAIIAEQKLLESRSVEHPTDGSGRFFRGGLDIILGSRRSAIKLSGMSSGIGDEPLYKSVQQLLMAIRDLAEP